MTAAPDSPRFAPWAARPGAAAALILGVALLRAVYIARLCPYTLIEDEAHYWEWSRHLDWSYYSKGPGIAWSIAAATRLFGDSEAGVRAPAVVFSAIGAALLYGLASAATGDRRVGFFTVCCSMLAPAFGVAGWLLTIDAPYLACWAGACWAAWLAMERGSRRAWVALGAALAIGFLFKYTIALLVPGLALYALVRGRRMNVAPGAWRWALASAAVALLGVVPVAVWNASHGWPTLRHLLGHLGLPGGDQPPGQTAAPYDPRWTLEFLGAQAGLIGPVILLIAAGAAGSLRARAPSALFLLLCAAPILAFYLAATLFSDAEGNWALGGAVTLLVFAGAAVVEGMDDYRRRVAEWRALPQRPRPWRGVLRRKPETFRQVAWHATLVIGLALALASMRLDLIEASAPARALSAWLADNNLKDPGPLMPITRLNGADRIAADAARLADDLRRQTGLEPFYIAQQYGRASLLAYYLPGRPPVYCSNSFQEGRRTQHDYWPQTDLTDLRTLGGRPAVLVGGHDYHWTPAFAEVRPAGELDGEPKAGRMSYLGLGYRGFPGRVAP